MNFFLITVLDTSEASHWGLPDGFIAVGREIRIILIIMITIIILNSYFTLSCLSWTIPNCFTSKFQFLRSLKHSNIWRNSQHLLSVTVLKKQGGQRGEWCIIHTLKFKRYITRKSEMAQTGLQLYFYPRNCERLHGCRNRQREAALHLPWMSQCPLVAALIIDQNWLKRITVSFQNANTVLSSVSTDWVKKLWISFPRRTLNEMAVVLIYFLLMMV